MFGTHLDKKRYSGHLYRWLIVFGVKHLKKITTINLVFTILLFNLVTSAPLPCSDTAKPMACCMSTGPQEGLAPAISAQKCSCHLSSSPSSEAPAATVAFLVDPNSEKGHEDLVCCVQTLESLRNLQKKYAAQEMRIRLNFGSDLKLYDLLSSYLIWSPLKFKSLRQ